MSQPDQKVAPGQTIDQDAEPGEAQPQHQPPPTVGHQAQLAKLARLLGQSHSDEDQAGQRDPELGLPEKLAHQAQSSVLTNGATATAARSSSKEHPVLA